MNYLSKHIAICALAICPAIMQAQTISFETPDYASIGVYDTWEQSPFRTGELQGNFAVLDNHLRSDDSNSSAKILGIQRSRFGSNTFGVRINLNETFELTPTVKYAHVMIHKPLEGRVMLIGLGKRTDRDTQSNDVEQFWAYPVNDTKTGEWFDAVFPIKGNGGIDIYSLVIVPHCEAPHTLSSDFVAYIDEIVINDDIRPRIGVDDYAVNFASDSGWGRSDRKITSVGLNGGSDGNQSISISNDELKGYTVKFETPLKAKAGDNVTPNFGYEGTWMHGYVYIDKGKDGQYSYGVNSSDMLDTSTDLVAYSLYRSASSGNAHNSAGSSISESNNGFNVLNPPAFTIPSNLAKGIYRMRYKIDWNNIDPGGNIDGTNDILANGGGVVDVLLNIHEDQVSVTQDNRNGEILIAATGNSINNDRIPFGQNFKIKMNPSNGFEYNGIRVRHGYNLTGDSIIKSTPQFRDEYFYLDEFGADDTFTIPGSVIDGDILIEGLFVEAGQGSQRRKVTYNLTIDGRVIDTQEFNVVAGAQYPQATIETEASSDYYTISGYPEGTVPDEDTSVNLVITQNLPFETSSGIDESTTWHTLTISADKNTISHNSANSYIDLAAASSGANAQWAFIGDIINGFKIVNRGRGEGYILSSSTSVTSSNDGNVYPIMTAEPVPYTNNTYWIPTKSPSISGESNGFYLHQLGHTNNRMNKRDNRLAYWVGGADGGSTFLATIVNDSMPDIDYCEPTPVSGRSVSNGKTNRTDRYVTNIAVSDGTSSITVTGGGSTSGRNVYADRTSSILNTEPGKEITLTISGLGYHCNTYIYVDTDLNGFDSADKVFSNWTDDNNGGKGNTLNTSLSFTLPDNLASGYYRVRYICMWSDLNDPCYYGDSGSDNGEAVIDFYLKVTSYATVTYLVQGNGAVEGWSKLDKNTGLPLDNAAQITNGATIATGNKTQAGFIFIPYKDSNSQQYAINTIVIENDDNTISLADNADQFLETVTDNTSSSYYKARYCVVTPITGNITVSATFADEISEIDKLLFDLNEGPVEIYNFNGVRIDAREVTPGIYIMRQGNKTMKVYIK